MDRRRPRKPPTRPLVLIVEGHEDTRMLYELALPAMGFDVVSAREGDDPYRRAWDMHPDIIVTDLPTTDGDGWPFLRDLRHDARTRDIPIVVVSGYVGGSVRERAERDFAAFFPKPCLPEDLAAGLRQVLDEASVRTSSGDDTSRRCPWCHNITLTFTNHYAVLTGASEQVRTGTDAHDGRDRLRYETAWVCQNPGCNYREPADGQSQ